MMPSSSSSGRPRPSALAGWLGPWVGVLGLALWAADPQSRVLVLAAAGVAAGAWWESRRSRARTLGLVVVIVGILSGFYAHRQVRDLAEGWPEYWAEREDDVGARLSRELDALMAEGEAAADALADLGSEPEGLVPPGRLADLREEHGVSALALYDLEGDLRVWDGVHRGRVPEDVQMGLRRYIYRDQPLFGYLYITAPAGGAGTAVAAFLLRADLPAGLAGSPEDFAAQFRREVGEQVRLYPVPLAEGQGGWELEAGGRTLLSVVLEPPDPGQRIALIQGRWRAAAAVIAVVAWGLLAVGGPARRVGGAVAGAALLVLLVALPPPAWDWLDPLFDPGLFRLPAPFPLTLGRVLLATLGLATVVAVLPRPRRRIPPALAGAGVAGLATVLLAWLRAGAAPGALAAGDAVWLAYQAAGTTAVALVMGMAVALSRHPRPRRSHAAVALVLGLVLGGVAGSFVWLQGAIPAWWPLLWAPPVAFLAASMDAWPGWRRAFVGWGAAAALAGTVAIPQTWGDHVEANRTTAEERLRRLASPRDERLEADLASLGPAAEVLDAQGENGVELLYKAFRASLLPDARHPVWLTLWSAAGVPQEELRVGVGTDRPVAADDAVIEATDPGSSLLAYDRSDARYVLRVPLRDGRILTAAAPPFSDRATRSPLSPLLAGGRATVPEPLTLIPIPQGDERAGSDLRWSRIESGWQGELPVLFPDAAYDAHYVVALPGVLLAVARASLLLVTDLVLVMLFWLLGASLLTRDLPHGFLVPGWRISFRARVTLALFGFFVLANALFGTFAYRAISGASARAAGVLAERVVDDAAGWYFEEQGAMELLARRVGAELLEYREGELREGSVEELVELGLYEGWIPFEIHQLLDGREGVRASERSALGSWEYITAYRRLPDGDLIATPIPLQTGATAVRSGDVVQIGGFAVLLGGALSLGLALLVGRALTRPIHALQVASERVGSGNLALRLPAGRSDEFGAVFRAFNRMVKRLRRARRQLLRTTRRTQAIMEEAAVGMIALDPGGRVTLVNPRAEELLGVAVTLGQPIPTEGAVGPQLAAWLARHLAGPEEDREAGGDLQDGERRLRVRARRLDPSGATSGVVVALEDVTDELRTERVLAWGEMARQVAHEVKNPLTPIKLSIQHIRRAWEDRRDDFGAILTRNVEAMLSEIDRLAAIAGSFSRFGAPGGSTSLDLVPVDVGGVVGEVLTLYGASDGPHAFVGDVVAGLPPARARVQELKEVLVNLLENARASLQQGGSVQVRAYPLGTERLAIDVIDDGAGIPADLLGRVFEPHFSTRSGGTGLGLAIVRRLVESWGGSVALDSRPGVGTRVTLVLRRWTAGGGAGTGPDPAGPSSSESGIPGGDRPSTVTAGAPGPELDDPPDG